MRNFEHEDVSIPQTEKSKNSASVVSCFMLYFLLSLNVQVRMSSYCFSLEDQFLFVGLSSGKIFYYKKKNMEARSIVMSGKDHEIVNMADKPGVGHKGEVRRLIYTKIDGLDVLISASADRTIKLWEPKNQGNKCFQTIIGHSGSILDMVYLEKVQLLFTSSTDNTMRIWRIDQARSLLMYPWFVEFQKVNDFPSVHTSNIKTNVASAAEVWLTCFDTKVGENLQVYSGDSEGSIYIFEALETWREAKDCIFKLALAQEKIHRIGLI